MTRFCHQKGLACDTAEDVDRAIEVYGNKLHFSKEPAVSFRYALYSYAFVHVLPTAGASFSRSRCALRSWLKINPEYSGDPCPFTAMALVVENLVKTEGALGLLAGRFVALMFDAYLRVAEAMALRMEDMLLPTSDKAYATYALIVAPQPGPEMRDTLNGVRRPANSGQIDSTIVIGDTTSPALEPAGPTARLL